jgi:Replication protein
MNQTLSIRDSQEATKGIFYRRARSKFVSDEIALELCTRKKSPLLEAYERTKLCCGVLLQEGKKVTSKYCNGRWCITCNRMRTAKLINGYKGNLLLIHDLQFVTLTIRSVPWFALEGTIKRMLRNFRTIKKQLSKRGIKIKGVRKIEATYDVDTGLYHPHFHLLIANRVDADYLILYWCLSFANETIRKAQDVRKFEGNEHNLVELFKYSTKMLASSKVKITNKVGRKLTIKSTRKMPAFALDRIFRALYNLRTFQAMGIPRVSEDIEELQSQVYEELEYKENQVVWKWGGEYLTYDWFDLMSGEVLTGYEPSDSIKQYLTNTS